MRTDGQLVQCALRGDCEAFGELVDRYRHMAYGLAYHLTGEFEAARDLAQESFIQAFLKLAQLREPEKFAGWLRQIVLNVQRMEYRRQKVVTVALGEEVEPVSQSAQLSEIDIVVREALVKLREPDRLAITLHYIDGYSYSEIAGFLSVSPETVKTRLARARQHLKKEITAMVEDSFQSKKLPDDFTSMTVSEAVRTLTDMLDEDVESGVRVRIHNNLGCIYHDKMSDPDKGREHLRIAAETADAEKVEPRFLHWRIYAWVSLRDHKWQEALDAAYHILEDAPTDFERRNLHVLIAAVKANLHQPEDALQHLRAAAMPGDEPPDADQWPFRVPAGTDPLEWARKNRLEYFSSVVDDPRFTEIAGD